jgi:phosphonate transport system substrate-binding protein
MEENVMSFSRVARCMASPKLILLLPLLLTAFLAGCEKAPENASEMIASSEVEDADLVIALLPERNVFEQKVKYLPLQSYLSEELELNVNFKLLDNYEQIFAEILDGQVDGGFWGSMNGAIAQERGGVKMLARPVWKDNTSTYWGYVFSLAESGIESDPKTWRGRSIAFVNRATTAGFLFPLSLLREAGVTDDPADYFSKPIFSGSHDAAIIAVLQGEVEMGACKNTIYQEFMERNPELVSRFRILSTSPEVPSNGLGVRPDLDEDLSLRLKEVLLAMHENAAGRRVLSDFSALKFIDTSSKDYAPVLKMAETAGIDLKNWPLRDVRDARPYR